MTELCLHFHFPEKTAIVTGASRGIGAAISHKLSEDGANVVVNYVNNIQAAEIVVTALNARRPNSAVAVRADVSNEAQAQVLLDQAIKFFGKVDIVVLNAGILEKMTLPEISEESYDLHFNTNVKGPLFLAKAAAPHLRAGSRIIFFSTTMTKGSILPPEYLLYTATKGAIEQITRLLAKDLGTRGITVNCIAPGPIDTDMFNSGSSPEALEFVANLAPSKRIGRPEEVANTVAFMASPATSWVNGQTLLVNGGFVV